MVETMYQTINSVQKIKCSPFFLLNDFALFSFNIDDDFQRLQMRMSIEGEMNVSS